ncbi:hypothetical protein MKW98_018367 [Papaver atlanticum]|uniref:Uncharacterized protein n=1 Tax=Papaver atlanticum TaxID=357466 RepID=A0AAD4T1C2_9MAGN|nr:hypothetical protein MKW98_018367 [Papaver atlanticum]
MCWARAGTAQFTPYYPEIVAAPEVVHGTIDGFSKMQMKAQHMPPVLINSINLPWRTHPGMPRAIQDMKENLTSRLPEWPVSKIEELNTLLLTDASSMVNCFARIPDRRVNNWKQTSP